jgi:hypothetical protein
VWVHSGLANMGAQCPVLSRHGCAKRHAKKSQNSGVDQNLGGRQYFTVFDISMTASISAARLCLKKP